MRRLVLWTASFLATGADLARLRTHTPFDAAFAEVLAGGSVAPSKRGTTSHAESEARPASTGPRAENSTGETKTPVLRPAAKAVEAAREAVEAVEGDGLESLAGAQANTSVQSMRPVAAAANVTGTPAVKAADPAKSTNQTKATTTPSPDKTVDDAVEDEEKKPNKAAPPKTKAEKEQK